MPLPRQPSFCTGRVLILTLAGLGLLGLTACKANNGSQVKVIGGEASTSQFLATVGLRIINGQTPQGYTSSCTGAFVRDDLLMTASHCLIGLANLNIVSDGGVLDANYPPAMQFNLNSRYTLKANGVAGTPEQLATDVSFVYFPKGTAAPDHTAALATTLPSPNDQVFVAGFGLSASGTAQTGGYRRVGSNHVSTVDSTFAGEIVLTRSGNLDGERSGGYR